MNCANAKNCHSTKPGSRRLPGFTMIELLVVMGVMAILAGLVIGGAGIINWKGKKARVEAEKARLIVALEVFKKEKGYYPPDNPGNPIMNPLFYELTGCVFYEATNTFVSVGTHELFTPGNVTTLFGRGGFVNAARDQNEVLNCFKAVAKQAGSASFTTNALSYTLFCLPVPGPAEMTSSDGRIVSPWQYVSTNPTNNSTAYDLWVDVKYGGKIYRFSNWSSEPQTQ